MVSVSKTKHRGRDDQLMRSIRGVGDSQHEDNTRVILTLGKANVEYE